MTPSSRSSTRSAGRAARRPSGESAAALADANAAAPRIVTGDAGLPPILPAAIAPPGARFRITLEAGGHVDGRVGGEGEHGTLPPLAIPGYHALDVGDQRIGATIAPPRATVDPRAADAGGRWGIAAQLYSLRRAGDDGAGDYTALARLAAHAARHGAQAVAISPTHAAFPALPAHDSPYSPSSRRWHNVAYLDCDAVPAPLPCLTQPVPRPTHR